MGVQIKNLTIDRVVQGQDIVVGTDINTGVSHNYTIDSIAAYSTAGTSSIINTKVIEVTEIVDGDFLSQINSSVTPIVVNTGDWVVISVIDINGNFKILYHLIKTNVTAQVLYGIGETQMVIEDLLILRFIGDTGEINTISSVGGTSLVSGKVVADLQIKGLESSTANLTITPSATKLIFNLPYGIGEVNTLEDRGAGAATLASTKSVSALGIKSIDFVGATVDNATEKVTVSIWSKIEKTASFTIGASYNRQTIWIQNDASNIEILIPSDLPADFECGIRRLGIGNVKFVADTGTLLLGTKNAINVQYASAWIETDPTTPSHIALDGDLKVI